MTYCKHFWQSVLSYGSFSLIIKKPYECNIIDAGGLSTANREYWAISADRECEGCENSIKSLDSKLKPHEFVMNKQKEVGNRWTLSKRAIE